MQHYRAELHHVLIARDDEGIGMTVQMWIRTMLWLAAIGGILFVSAGDPVWPQGWFYLGLIAFCSSAVCLWLARHDPALLESRLASPFHPDQKPWDRVAVALAGIIFIAWMVFIALDARRFRWSHVPLWVQAVGALLIGLGMVLVWQAFRFNSFAAPQVRVQTGRAHRVITDGPYHIVRHPMYAGAVLYLIGMPLLLGSWWGLLCVPLLITGLAARAVGEEKMLRRELAGYDAYARRTKYRLVPGIW
jgi:protein-S-isoprenylcysteine O-methyltransferase Ste14